MQRCDEILIQDICLAAIINQVVVQADTEQEAIEKVKNLKSEDVEWQSHALKKERVTYEVFIKSDKDSTE